MIDLVFALQPGVTCMSKYYGCNYLDNIATNVFGLYVMVGSANDSPIHNQKPNLKNKDKPMFVTPT